MSSWRAISAAGLIVLAATIGACSESDSDDLSTAVLTVVDLGEEVQGWRLRAEARASDLDGSPTFYFSDSEEVAGSSMISAETTLSARSYLLVVELADSATNEVRLCKADVTISEGEMVALSVEAGSIVEVSLGELSPACLLKLERSTSG